jgi:nicotinate-nucleotide--dimethylbenzimidazole phosphoribosyltransferase
VTPRGRIPEPDDRALREARDRQADLTKPAGSLGVLEDVAVQLAAWQGDARPSARPAAVLIFAADHPVTRHGVSAYPASVTRAMLENFACGGAAASVLSQKLGLPLHVVDVGVGGIAAARRGSRGALLVRDPVADDPAGDIRVQDAMTRATYERALQAGRSAVDRLGTDVRVLLLGEMGIGNTTVASAVCAALLGGEPALYVGNGTGVDGPTLVTKRRVVADAVVRLGRGAVPAEVLRRIGGRDIVALAGAMGRALERRMAIIVDGFIVTAAALALVRSSPSTLSGMIFSHRSDEQAHGRVLEELGVRPLLSLDLRLGEASGALVAYPLLELACALHNDMATFESAGVPERMG